MVQVLTTSHLLTAATVVTSNPGRGVFIALSPDQWPGDEANVFTTTMHTFANTHLVPCIIIIIMCVQCTCVLLQIMYVI